VRGPQAGAEAACLGEERDLCWISTSTHALTYTEIERERERERARERASERASDRERERASECVCERGVNHELAHRVTRAQRHRHQVAHMHIKACVCVSAHTGAWLLNSRKQPVDNSGI
jgi:hypothetical protein